MTDTTTTQIKEGFVVITGIGKRWTDSLYPTMQAAMATADAAGLQGYSIKPAKRLWDARRWRSLEWIVTEGEA